MLAKTATMRPSKDSPLFRVANVSQKQVNRLCEALTKMDHFSSTKTADGKTPPAQEKQLDEDLKKLKKAFALKQSESWSDNESDDEYGKAAADDPFGHFDDSDFDFEVGDDGDSDRQR